MSGQRNKSYISKKLIFLSYFWISLPVSYLVGSYLFFGLDFADIIKVLLSPWYWIICFAAVASGRGIMNIRWYGWYAFLFSNVTLLYQTAVELAHYSKVEFKIAIFAIQTVIQIVILFFVGKEIRVPYFFPRVRWWESDPRYKLSVQTKLIRPDQSELEGEIMDLSLGGCFIKTHSYFAPDEILDLQFTLFERKVTCRGRVVWRTESTVTHPKGIGVKFDSLPKETAIVFKQSTKKLKKLAQVYNQMSREKNWQEYLQREQSYQNKSTPKKK